MSFIRKARRFGKGFRSIHKTHPKVGEPGPAGGRTRASGYSKRRAAGTMTGHNRKGLRAFQRA